MFYDKAMNFCKLLSDRGRVNFWKLCQEFGVNPHEEPDERGIHVEAKIEDEIAEIMAEVPNYTISKEGRE